MPGETSENAWQDAAGKWRREESPRARVERQRRSLANILGAPEFLGARMPQALEILCREAAFALDVARVSVWRWGPERDFLECLVQWSQDHFDPPGNQLEIARFPVYFEALERDHRVEAHDVSRHPAVRQLLDFYLVPLGISSMLDAGILVDGRLAGVICLEHVGTPRRWTPDEVSFASTAAALAGLVFAQEARQRAEAEARRLQDRYRLLVEASHDVIFTLDTTGMVSFASPQWQMQLGYDVEREVVGRHFREFLHEQDLGAAMQVWEQALQGRPIRGFEYRARARNGSYRRYACNADPQFLEDGQIGFFVCSARDITEKHRTEQRRAEEQRLESIGRLAGGVAHEFNNMLEVILGHCELLAEEHLDKPALLAELQEIRNAALRSARLTSQLLAYAQKRPGTPERLDVNAEIERAMGRLGRILGPDIRLSWRPGLPLAPVHFDAGWLQDILEQLCLRAKDAIAGAGQMEIASRMETVQEREAGGIDAETSDLPPPGTYVRIDVADTGIPVADHQVAHLFDPFAPGSGLSAEAGMRLAGIHGMVRQGGGFIFAHAESGTSRFSIFLPAVPESQAADVLPVRPEGAGKLVLVVDDEISITRMVQMILGRYGIRAVTASDPRAVLEMVERNGPDIGVLLSDVAMPGMNGFELVKAVRCRQPGIRVIYMSGYPRDSISGYRDIPREDGFLQKPFTVEELLSAVNSRN